MANKVQFFIEFKQKGMEYIKKYREEIGKISANATAASAANNKLDDSLDKTSKSTDKATKGIKDLNSNIEKGSQKAKDFGKNLGIAIAAGTAALALYSKKLIDAADAQGKLAVQAGVDFKTFQVYSRAAELSGISIDTLTRSFQDLNNITQEAALGEGEGVKFIKALNLDAKELAKLRPEKQLELIVKSLENIPDLQKKLFLDKLKIKDIELLVNNFGQIEQINDKITKNGLFLNNTAEIEAFNDQITETIQDINAFSTIVLGELIPKINKLYQSEAGENSLLNRENAEELSDIIVHIIKVMGLLTNTVLLAVEGLAAATEGIVSLSVKLGTELSSALKTARVEFEKYTKLIKENEFSELNKDIGNNFIDSQQKKISALQSNLLLVAGVIKKVNKDIGDDLEKTINTMGNTANLAVDLNQELFTKSDNKTIKDAAEERKKIEEDRIKEINTIEAREEIILQKRLQKIRDRQSKLSNSYDDLKYTQREKKVVEEVAKEAGIDLGKNFIDGFEEENKKDLGNAFEDSISIINDRIKNIGLKVDLGLYKNQEDAIKDITEAYNELEAMASLNNQTETEILNIQLQKKRAIESLNKETSKTREILNLELALLKEQGREIEATELERKQAIENINNEFSNLEERAKVVDLTNKIFDLKQFRNNLNQVETDIDNLKNRLNSSKFFGTERIDIENELNSKLKERDSLMEQLGEKQKEENEDMVFTVERINQLNEQLKDSFLDIFSDFASGTKSAKEAFNDFATFFLKKISEMVLEQLYLNAISSLGGGTGGTTAGLGSSFLSLFSSMPVFDGGGIVGKTQPMFQVPGLTDSTQSLAIVQKGEQISTRNQQNNSKANGSLSSSGVVNNTIILDSDSIAKSSLETQSGIDGVIKIIRKNSTEIKNLLG